MFPYLPPFSQGEVARDGRPKKELGLEDRRTLNDAAELVASGPHAEEPERRQVGENLLAELEGVEDARRGSDDDERVVVGRG